MWLCEGTQWLPASAASSYSLDMLAPLLLQWLQNYETVKVFGNEWFELRQFGGAIDAFQGAEFKQMACVALLNMGQ